MARTQNITRTQDGVKLRGRAKKREQPLGAAIGWGLAATLGTAVFLTAVLLSLPGTAAHNFFRLSLYNPSATLPLDPLYQKWLGQLQEEEALLVTPLSLLCGGLTLGRLAPSYASRRRVLLSGAALGFGVLAVSLAFLWAGGTAEQNTLNAHEGGQQVTLTVPPELILRQILWGLAWIGVCVLGTWLGLMWRGLRAKKPPAATSSPAD